MKHQSHRVVPIKNSFKNIQDDNKTNEKRLAQVVEYLDSLYNKAAETMDNCEIGLEKTLKDLNDEYDTIQRVLVEKFELARAGVIAKYNELGATSKVL